MKNITILFFSLSLMACGGGSSSSTTTTSTVNLTATGETLNIDRTDLYDLNLTIINSTVNISTDDTINDFHLVGSNNIITLAGGTGGGSILYISVVGDDNTFNIPSGSTFTFDDLFGSGNSVVYY